MLISMNLAEMLTPTVKLNALLFIVSKLDLTLMTQFDPRWIAIFGIVCTRLTCLGLGRNLKICGEIFREEFQVSVSYAKIST